MIIVWTLGRTGGTATTAVLRRLLGGRETLHEPLNSDQPWGDISRRLADADIETVASELRKRATARPIIKHCVDTVPYRVTESLVYATTDLDYRHVVLIRRNESARSMSSLLMRATGAASRQELDAISAATISGRLRRLTKGHLVKLIAESRVACERLNRLHALISRKGIDHKVVAYEDLFQTNPKGLDNVAFRGLLDFLGIDSERVLTPADEAFLQEWLVDGGQRSARFYPEIERYLGALPHLPNVLDFDTDGEAQRP